MPTIHLSPAPPLVWILICLQLSDRPHAGGVGRPELQFDFDVIVEYIAASAIADPCHSQLTSAGSALSTIRSP